MLQNRPVAKELVFQRRWARTTVDQVFLEPRRMHRMPPILTEKLVIQGNSIDGIMAFKRSSGSLVWKFHVHGGVEGGAQLVDGVLYFGANDGFFYAIDVDTGHQRWTFPIHFEGLGEPFVDKGIVYFIAGNNVAYALEAQSGKQLWLYNRRDASSLSIRGGSRPATDDKFVYIGFSDGYIVALEKNRGQVQWEAKINNNKRFRDVDSGPVLEKGLMYVTSYDGGLYCLNTQTGKILWENKDGGFSSPLLYKDYLIYTTSGGKVMAVKKATGETVWTRTLTGQIATRPALINDLLVFGEYDGVLRGIRVSDGEPLLEYAPGRGVTSPPTVDPSSNEIYFISADANLFALQLTEEPRPSLINRQVW
jgi:outer membrane protein assembly factor BamB